MTADRYTREVVTKRTASVGQSIGGILVGFDQQIFRTTPPVNELVAKGDRLAPVAAAGGGTMRIGMPGDPAPPLVDDAAERLPAADEPAAD